MNHPEDWRKIAIALMTRPTPWRKTGRREHLYVVCQDCGVVLESGR